jgi:hypothetical protein
VDAGELGEQAQVGAIGAGEGELVEEVGRAPVERPEALATGLMGEGAADERLAGAGSADHQEILVFLDPAATGELPDEGFVELAPSRIVDGFHGA